MAVINEEGTESLAHHYVPLHGSPEKHDDGGGSLEEPQYVQKLQLYRVTF